MSEHENKKLTDVSALLRERFERLKEHNPNDGRYKCWDCEKEIFDVSIDEKTKKTLPMDLHGFRSLICKECAENEEY